MRPFNWVFCVKLSQQIVHSNVFFILHELDCKEFSVLMVAESMCQAYFLHELNPCVLALHRNLTWKNTCCKICDIRFTQSRILKWHISAVHEGKKPFLCTETFLSRCPFNWVFCVKLAPQIVHSNGFFISWTGLQRA